MMVEPSTLERLIALHDDPPRAAGLAAAHRNATFGPRIAIAATPGHAIPEQALVLRNPDGWDRMQCDRWPSPTTLRPGDRLIVQVDASAEGRAAFARWLLEPATWPEPVWVAPCSKDPAGLHRLWCIAAARLALPAHVHVEARHDLIGIRLAQLALGFGADTLAGPLESDRVLPLAGVTRPSETSRTALATLVRQAGLEPVDPEAPSSSPIASQELR